SETEKNNIQKELDIPNNAVVMGHIGRFSPVKNHTFILDVFKALLEKKNDNYYLLLIGEGKLLPDIKEKAKEMGLLNNIRFLGLRKDIPQLLSFIDYFIFPSIYEGLGISLIEAQASGKNCIISENITIESIIVVDLISVKKISEYPYIMNNTYKYIITKATSDTNAKNKVRRKGYD